MIDAKDNKSSPSFDMYGSVHTIDIDESHGKFLVAAATAAG